MACPDTGIIRACDFPQFLVNQTPKFDEIIMRDIRPTDGWLLNVGTGTMPMGTPPEVTQDRFRHVFPNVTKQWIRVQAPGVGCIGNPCDPREHQIAWGAERLTYYPLQQTWATPLQCYDQDMHVTHAIEHINQIINDILRPATTTISSALLRKMALYWAKYRHVANGTLENFTFQWSAADLDGDGVADDEIYFDCSVPPNRVFMLVPQMLQYNFQDSMLEGYAGQNPFKETLPFIELVAGFDTLWLLDKLGAQQMAEADAAPNVIANWRFTNWGDASGYWRYGFSGQIGNYLVRVDPMEFRFNFYADLGPASAPNRYRYQIVLPYRNMITTGAGGAAGLGSEVNPDYKRALYRITFQWHKLAMQLLTPDARPISPEMPFGHRDFGGKWRFLMHDLGSAWDPDNQQYIPINNSWENKGKFGAWFKYWVRPMHTEFARVYFHKAEGFCIPEINTCAEDPGYPQQTYTSELPPCPIPDELQPKYGTGVPSSEEAGPVPPPQMPPSTWTQR